MLHTVVILPFLFACFVPLLRRLWKSLHTGWFVLVVPVILFLYFFNMIGDVSNGGVMHRTIPWIPSLGIQFSIVIDGLALLFALLITGIGMLVVLYSIYYLEKDKEKLTSFYIYLLMFMGAMLGVVVSDNVIVLYAFWELTSFSSFFLIAYWTHRERSRYGAQKSMLITVFGGLCMLAGFLLLFAITGTFSIREMIGSFGTIAEHSLFIPSMLLILLGAFTKSAQFPFHIWLPDAMEAPTPISAYLHSATMVKAGIYLVARLSPLYGGESLWFWLVGGVGLLTLIWGSFQAVRQTDLKAMLAFSTISQLGLIMGLLGIGSAALYDGQPLERSIFYSKAVLAAIFHLINHATFKGALFMIVGIVDHQTGTRNLRHLGGLMALMPISFTIMLIGSFSMAGLPPFNGFLSKEMFFTAMLQVTQMNIFQAETWGVLFPVIAWIASVFTFVYSMRIVFHTFGGKLQTDFIKKTPKEAPLGMLLPPLVLASFVVIFGLFPNVLSYTILEPAVSSILPTLLQEGESFSVQIDFWHGWSTELYMSLGVFAAGSLLFFFLQKWIAIYRLFPRRLSFNTVYDRGLYFAERSSRRLNKLHMTESVRDYLIYIFTFMIVILGYSLWRGGTVRFDIIETTNISLYEWLLSIAIVGAALAAVVTTNRLAAIISVGTVGYVLALFFVNFRAPDLALTQLVIETVSVCLFLLCFYHLPKLRKQLFPVRFKVTNVLISAGVGIIVTAIALQVQGVDVVESISKYYVENSYKEAGGRNMVNVILVDFRGFDTMLEILVLGIAALGVLSLIKLKMMEGDGR